MEAIDPAAGVRKMVLRGGLTLLGAHDERATTCLLRLVVRVGSMDEADDERTGIAHFIEHCGFRGTKTHENGTLHKFVESLGCQFGADLNAKTGLCETIWMLNVPVAAGPGGARPGPSRTRRSSSCYSDGARASGARQSQAASAGGSACASADATSDRERLVASLHVLSEWAHSIRFSEADVEAERAVIEEEFRMKRGPSQRVKDTYWKRVLPRVGARIPIGTLASIRAITRQDLVAFYERHYTLDRMALVAVGNLSAIGGAEGLAAVADEAFARGAGRRDPRDRVPISLALRAPEACVIREKALTSTTVSFEFYGYLPLGPETRPTFLKREVVKRVFTSVLEARLRELSSRPLSQGRDPDAQRLVAADRGAQGGSGEECEAHGPWVSAGVACHLAFHDRAIECTSVSGQCHRSAAEGDDNEDVRIQAVVRCLVREIVRLERHGVSADEVEFAKQKWRHVFRRKLRPTASRDEVCGEICEELVQHFCLREEMPVQNYRDEAEQALGMLDAPESLADLGGHASAISAADVWGFARETLSALTRFDHSDTTNVAIVLQGQHCGTFDEAALEQVARQAAQLYGTSTALKPWAFHPPLDSIEEIGRALLPVHYEAFVDAAEPLDGVDPAAAGGDRAWTCVEMPRAGARCYELSNGLRVCVKDNSKAHPNKVSFQAFALGGCAALSEQEDVAFSLLNATVQASGLGMLDDLSLSRVESSHQCSVRFQQHWFHRGIGGSCASDKLELLLQMLVASLLGVERNTAGKRKQLDRVAFERHLRIARDGIDNGDSSDSPDLRFAEQVRQTMIGEREPVLRTFSAQSLAEVSLKLVQDLYHDAFTRDPASEFTFVFSGDLSVDHVGSHDRLGDLLDRYLGRMLEPTGIESKRWAGPTRLPRTMQLSFPETETINTFTYASLQQCEQKGSGGDADEDDVATEVDLAPSGEQAAAFQTDADLERAGADDDKAQVVLGHLIRDGWTPASELQTELEVRVACLVAQIRLLEHLRTDQSLIYTIGVEQSRNSLAPFSMVFTSLTCRPAQADKVIHAVFAEFGRLGTEGSKALEEARSAVRKQLEEWHRKACENNSHWLFWLLDAWKRYAVSEPDCTDLERSSAWVDRSAAEVCDAGAFSRRVNEALGRLPDVYRTQFKDRVAVCMIKDAASAARL